MATRGGCVGYVFLALNGENVGRYRHKMLNAEPKENRATVKNGILTGISCCFDFLALFEAIFVPRRSP